MRQLTSLYGIMRLSWSLFGLNMSTIVSCSLQINALPPLQPPSSCISRFDLFKHSMVSFLSTNAGNKYYYYVE